MPDSEKLFELKSQLAVTRNRVKSANYMIGYYLKHVERAERDAKRYRVEVLEWRARAREERSKLHKLERELQKEKARR